MSSKPASAGIPYRRAPRGVAPITITIRLNVVLQLGVSGVPQLVSATIPAQRPARPPAGTPAAKRWLAEARREMLMTYFAALSGGAKKREAVNAARKRGLEIFDEAPHEQTIRRLAAAIEKRKGGIDAAPLRAFYDGREKSRRHASLSTTVRPVQRKGQS